MKRLLLVFLLAIVTALLATRAEAQVIVIANPGVKAADVSKSDLREIFTGGTTNLAGSNVTPAILKQGAAHTEFLASYLGKSDTAFRAGWRSLAFSGQSALPRSFDSEAALVEYVAHTAGAIGYIGKATPHEGVKVLALR